MSRASGGSDGALGVFYTAHHSWLEQWLRRKLGNAWDAADLSQDTFIRVMSSAQPIGEVAEPRAYLRTIGNRLLINLYRRRSLEQAYLETLAAMPEDVAPSTEQRWLILEALQALDEMLNGLSAVVRRAFLMSQLEGLTYPEIAMRLGVSERTVKRHMALAYEHCLLSEWR
ncbi:sigma-70 family RNA polymerase sigma factor [Pseudomonas matsuisoli]|uniref:RNA polymerase sigma factor n=1 Tax=Pseudomonas matsuisoli TaxID=1515666 RepID=A0A917PM40_9PSED|nr:sigma-70 family RNA polymerase sigma factor [Pseudomonas matsuisoli]GGJ84631.1 RNA polymerase sigma factor [Pseudomonas matsuisoli]